MSPSQDLPADLTSATLVAIDAIAGATDRQSLLAAIGTSLAPLNADNFDISLFREGGAELELVVAWERGGEVLPFPAGTRFRCEDFPTLDLIKAGAPFVVDDCATDPRLNDASRRVFVE